jgi:hypothetical protein
MPKRVRCANPSCSKSVKIGPRSPATKKYCSSKCRVEAFWAAKIQREAERLFAEDRRRGERRTGERRAKSVA